MDLKFAFKTEMLPGVEYWIVSNETKADVCMYT